MKDLSFFLFKNSLGAKMRKGITTFCNGDGSTSTLNQHKTDDHGDPDQFPNSLGGSPYLQNTNSGQRPPPTLEEMILQLELEEEVARKAKLKDQYGRTVMQAAASRRMSCVNSSDILRSARNALNQYPRFSLDGKDAMYRSSFRNLDGTSVKKRASAGRKSVCLDDPHRQRERLYQNHDDLDSNLEKILCLPQTLAGESVVWCKPGVIAKLMGLDAMPVPINSKDSKDKLSYIIKRQNLRRRAERHEMERRPSAMDMNRYDGIKRGSTGSCSNTGYRVMKPVAAVESTNGGGRWPTRCFL